MSKKLLIFCTLLIFIAPTQRVKPCVGAIGTVAGLSVFLFGSAKVRTYDGLISRIRHFGEGLVKLNEKSRLQELTFKEKADRKKFIEEILLILEQGVLPDIDPRMFGKLLEKRKKLYSQIKWGGAGIAAAFAIIGIIEAVLYLSCGGTSICFCCNPLSLPYIDDKKIKALKFISKELQLPRLIKIATEETPH